jgi:CBS domain-containing protein
MNKKVVFLSPDDTVEKASEFFARTGQNPIPVTNESGGLIGIISRSDLIKLFSTRHIDA